MRVDDLARQHLEAALQRRDGAVCGDVLDREDIIGGDDDGLLVGLEVVVTQGRDARLRAGRERLVAVRVLLRVVLHGERRTPIAVALTQHGVHGGALDAVVAGADVLLIERLRVVRVVRDVEALRLQLRDGGLQLRDRGRDVRELDDVRLGQRGETSELGERVADLLLGGQLLRERREDAGRERDVAGLDIHPRCPRHCLDDRQERGRCQSRRLIGVGIEDGRVGHRRCFRFGSSFQTIAPRKYLDIEILRHMKSTLMVTFERAGCRVCALAWPYG